MSFAGFQSAAAAAEQFFRVRLPVIRGDRPPLGHQPGLGRQETRPVRAALPLPAPEAAHGGHPGGVSQQ